MVSVLCNQIMTMKHAASLYLGLGQGGRCVALPGGRASAKIPSRRARIQPKDRNAWSGRRSLGAQRSAGRGRASTGATSGLWRAGAKDTTMF